MRVTIIGCAGSFPGPDSAASCYLVQADGFSMLLDMGNGSVGALQKYHDLFDVDAVCLSHLHPDHCFDLSVYWVARTFRPGGALPPLPVYGPPDTAERMARAYDTIPQPGLAGAFDFRPFLREDFQVGPFSITTSLVNHPVEAYAFRIEHEGSVLAYSGDTGRSADLVDIAKGAHLFLCEASFMEKSEKPNPPDMHLTGKEASDHAALAGVNHLVLTHLIPWNDSQQTLEDARQGDFGGTMELAAPGTVYEF